jgi:hypothetical protein
MGQREIHARFESSLFERCRDRCRIAPAPLGPVRNPRDFTFDRIREGTQLVPAILLHDRNAIGARDFYDDEYYTAFFKAVGAVLERRLNESIAAVAAMIAGAGRLPAVQRCRPTRRSHCSSDGGDACGHVPGGSQTGGGTPGAAADVRWWVACVRRGTVRRHFAVSHIRTWRHGFLLLSI